MNPPLPLSKRTGTLPSEPSTSFRTCRAPLTQFFSPTMQFGIRPAIKYGSGRSSVSDQAVHTGSRIIKGTDIAQTKSQVASSPIVQHAVVVHVFRRLGFANRNWLQYTVGVTGYGAGVDGVFQTGVSGFRAGERPPAQCR